MVRIISFEGNIGSGKSTFIKNFQNYYENNITIFNEKICFLQEPVDVWNTITDLDYIHACSSECYPLRALYSYVYYIIDLCIAILSSFRRIMFLCNYLSFHMFHVFLTSITLGVSS